jgi:alpha-beta hydrolase superfamily lysophospholipase
VAKRSETKSKSTTNGTEATRLEQPIILIRGFGGLSVEDEKRVAYQGFNDGTVYPQKTGDNYIYEGLVLRFMKSRWDYNDATNVVGYYNTEVRRDPSTIPAELAKFDIGLFSGDKIVIDPGTALNLVTSSKADVLKTLWVFRYYDLDDREDFARYGRALVRLIEFIRTLCKLKHPSDEAPKVNIVAHSMGGLIVREAVQRSYRRKGEAAENINKIVTLGTPHQGISFQLLRNWIGISAAKELEQFNPEWQEAKNNPVGYLKFAHHFPPARVLTVVGTNYRTYGPVVTSWLNRAFSVGDEFGPNYNRSDGLVKQAYAQLPGAPRTFVHKCHGGQDSLVTSREAFEIATRFFFGNIYVRLNLIEALVKRGKDLFGKSEFYFGVSIKPRKVDFDLFHQSAEAENCYGPFSSDDFSNKGVAFNWADRDTGERLIWEGWLDTSATTLGTDKPAGGRNEANGEKKESAPDIVMRLDFYVGERDLLGIGFSDNVVFRKQYYARAVFDDLQKLKLRKLMLHKGENFEKEEETGQAKEMELTDKGWAFKIEGSGFEARLGLTFKAVPERG